MKKILVSCAAITMMLLAANAKADIQGSVGYYGDWKISGLYDTAPGNEQYWAVKTPQDSGYVNVVKGEFENIEIPQFPGAYLFGDGKTHLSGEYSLRTKLNFERVSVNDPTTTIDLILNAAYSADILKPGEVDIFIGDAEGNSLFGSSYAMQDGEGYLSFTLGEEDLPGEYYLYMNQDISGRNLAQSGIKFSELGDPPGTTPEPATLALLGLGALALPVARRFRKK